MRPDRAAPGRGVFVRDQVAALAALPDVDVELYEFHPGVRAAAGAALSLARRRARTYDEVHAQFGLSAYPALAVRARARVLTVHGTDVRHPRTGLLTRAVARTQALVAAPTHELLDELGPGIAQRGAVLPCGVSLERLKPMRRDDARAALGLDPRGPYVLFPAAASRAGKRHDLALDVAGDVPLLTLEGIAPEQVWLWVNAANAVVVPSDAEGFGLAVLEALACDVPGLATPVGIHAEALDGIAGTLCAPYDRDRWREALQPHLRSNDPRVDGRARAAEYGADRMALLVLQAWRSLVQG